MPWGRAVGGEWGKHSTQAAGKNTNEQSVGWNTAGQASGRPGCRPAAFLRAQASSLQVGALQVEPVYASTLPLASATIFSWMWLGTTSYFSSCGQRGMGQAGRFQSGSVG